MGRRLLALLAVMALVGGACGDDDEDEGASSATTAAEAGGPQTLEIGVDAKSDEVNSAWIRFFPDKVKARPGDTIEFKSAFTGEPHTVAAGTLVNEVLETLAKFPEAENSEGPPPPEVQEAFAKLPFGFSEEAETFDDAIVQAAAQPCFLESGDVPTKEACPKDKQEPPAEFTGKERLVNSGFMPDEQTLSLKLADDIAPGTYTFICLFHGPEMTEEVTVVAKDTAVPGADQVAATADKELDELVAKVKGAADEIMGITGTQAKGGAFPEAEGVPSAGVNVFPTNIAAKTGEKVTWELDGPHSVSFNAPEDARPWLQFDDSGTVVVNKKSVDPAGSPPIPAPPEAPEGQEDGPPPQVKVDGGRFDGQGFRSSGIPFDGALVYSLTFSKAGTYKYLCLLHPDMEGTVTVT